MVSGVMLIIVESWKKWDLSSKSLISFVNVIDRAVSSIQLFSAVFYFSIQSLSQIFIQYLGIRPNLSRLIFFGKMSDLQVVGGAKKLNNQNYNS